MRDTPIISLLKLWVMVWERNFCDEVSHFSDARLTGAHLDANHADTATWLASQISDLDNIVIEALLAEETRPRFVPVNDGVLLILRGNLNANADPKTWCRSEYLWTATRCECAKTAIARGCRYTN